MLTHLNKTKHNIPIKLQMQGMVVYMFWKIMQNRIMMANMVKSGQNPTFAS
jgi:hypothetical protein